jgi:hypothetical protein
MPLPRFPLTLLPGALLLAVSAAAQAPAPNTLGDRHPHVRKDRGGNYVFRNEHLVAVLEKQGDGYGPLVLYPASRPTQPPSLPIATVPEIAGNAVRQSGDDTLIISGGAAPVELEIDRDPWLSWTVRPSAGGTLTLLGAGARPSELLIPGVARIPMPAREERPASTEAVEVPTTRLTAALGSLTEGETTAAVLWDHQPERGRTLPSVRFQAGSRDAAPSIALQVSGTTEGKLLVLREEPQPTAAIREWAEIYQSARSDPFGQRVLDVPRPPREPDAEWAFSRAALGRITEGVDPALRAVLLQMDPLRVKPRGGQELRSQAEQVAATVRQAGPLDLRLAYRVGGVIPALAAEEAVVQARIDDQLTNGSWPSNQPVMSFPETVPYIPAIIPLVTQNALRILRYAAVTGHSNSAGAGIRAIELLERDYGIGKPTDTPRVPLPELDLRTIAEATECYLLGYQVTGERRYLDGARFWADTGLPYVFLWSQPGRPAMRGAALSRLGEPLATPSTALEFARVLAELHRVRPDRLHYNAARSIVAGAEYQQASGGELPEHWNVAENRPEGELRSPAPLLAALQAVRDLDTEVGHTRVRVGPDRLFVAGGASVRSADTSAMRLRLNLRWLAGQDTFMTITGVVARPLRVEYNSEELLWTGITLDHRFLSEAESEDERGWFYDEGNRLLILRIPHTGGDDRLEIRWPDPRQRAPVERVDTKVRRNR